LFLKEHWEWESSGVLGVDLFNFNSSVRKEVVEDVVLITTIIGSVFPEDVETEHFSVIVEETLESFVWSSTFQLNLDVVLQLGLIWRSLFVIDHSSGVSEKIFWVCLRLTEWDTLIGKETPGEIVAVDKSEDSLVDIEIDANIEIRPYVIFGLVLWVWKFVSFQKDALRNTGVLNSWLDDVDGVIVEVVVDNALSNSVVFVWILDYWFLEVSTEGKHL
jgi:hypothetical protein